MADSTGRTDQEEMPVDVRADIARSQAEELDVLFDRCAWNGPRCAFRLVTRIGSSADMMAGLKQGGGSRLAEC